MGLGRTLAFRGITLIAVVIGIVLITTVILGPSSDVLLNAFATQATNEYAQGLAASSTGATNVTQLQQLISTYHQQLVRSLALDQPWYQRIVPLALRIMTLNLGTARAVSSFTGSIQIRDIIIERLPATIVLLTTATVIDIFLGLYLGTKVALRRGGRIDRLVSVYAAISYALPPWWLGLLLIFTLVYQVQFFPPPTGIFSPQGATDAIGRSIDVLRHAALPIITLVLATLGSSIYITRTIVLRITEEDFVFVAKAKGLPEGKILRSYVMRVAAPPLLTSALFRLAGSIGGAILTETVFNWPGIGRLFYNAIGANEEALILGLVYVFALVYVITRFSLEVAYVFLDPRVRY